MALNLRSRIAWAHEVVSDPTLVAAFQTLPGADFTVIGAAPIRDSALLSLGSEVLVSKRSLAVAAKLDSQLASHAQTYTGTGTLRVSW